MKEKNVFLLFALAFLLVQANAQEIAPVAVSPGNESGLAMVGQTCPTFSWTAVDWAAGYRVVVFETATTEVQAYEAMAAITAPVMSKGIRGRASSWTPSSAEQLQTGGLYVWYVQALDYSGQGVWSEGKAFTVDAGVWPAGMAETIRKSLRAKGVGEDVIGEVLKDIRAGQNGSTVPEADRQGGFNTQDKMGIQGLEGTNNTFYGVNAGASITSGMYDTFIGSAAGHSMSSGFQNNFIGYAAGGMNNGTYNTCVGNYTGYYNQTGTANVFLGYMAGHYEAGSNKLYIANSGASFPLIYGEFDNNLVGINGKLGIGTQSPATNMELETTGENAIFLIDRTDGATIYFAAKAGMVNFGSASAHPVRFVVGGGVKMSLNTDGSLDMSSGARCTAGGTWQNSSSRQLKENIEGLTADEAMEALGGLEPVKFNYKADKGEKHVGFIAEDVPDLVATKDRKGLSPMDVVAVLTKVVQDQQKTIDELGREIAELKHKMK
jgi:hypothetical protein